jgi:alpha-glucosidase
VLDLPEEFQQDPQRLRGEGAGRDGCRVPMPWDGSEPPYGFSPEGASRPWLDPPGSWAALTVAAQTGQPSSTLELYRAGLRLRRTAPWGGDDGLRWLPSSETVLAFERGDGFACLVNFGPDPVKLPAGARVLIASSDVERGAVPKDTTVWLRYDSTPQGNERETR